MRRTLAGHAMLMAVEGRSAFDEQRTQTVWPVFGFNEDNERASWRNRNEIGMRHSIAFATDYADFVRHERYGSVEFSN